MPELAHPLRSLLNGFTIILMQKTTVKFEEGRMIFSMQSFLFLLNYGVIKQTIAHRHVF